MLVFQFMIESGYPGKVAKSFLQSHFIAPFLPTNSYEEHFMFSVEGEDLWE
jgi:hypothetical protein